MSGFYNNWLKVQNPNVSNDIVGMESGGYQKPFYFGGSQVPVNLGIDNSIQGGGMSKVNFRPEMKGKGVQQSLHKKYSNIHLPRKIM